MPNLNDIKYKLGQLFKFDGGGDKSQYFLAAGLVLIILIAGISMFTHLGGGPQTEAPGELYFYDVELQKEVVLKREDITPEMTMEMGPGMGRMVNPETGERTLVQMLKCPNCGKYHVPDAWLEEDFNPMMDPGATADIVCPHCGTNREEYYREKIRQRRGE